MRRTKLSWVVALVLTAIVAAGCTGGGDKVEEGDAATTTTADLPPECKPTAPTEKAEGSDDSEKVASTTTTLPEACTDGVFINTLQDQGSEELSELDEGQLLSFGHGMCAYARALKEDPENAPTYDELVKSTSQSWGVSGESVEEVLGLAATLCPGELNPILKLRKQVGEVTVQMSVTGTSPASVTYTLRDGDSLQDEVTSPWEHEVILDPDSDFQLVASSAKGKVTCTVTVKDKKVVSKSAEKGKEAICAATSAKLRDAAR